MSTDSNTSRLDLRACFCWISAHSDGAILSIVERCAFVLFFLGASTATSHAPLVEIGLMPIIPYGSLLMCLPGAIIGGIYWCTRRSQANSYPVLLAIAFVIVGMLTVDPTERGRAMLVTASLLCALAAGAWIEAKGQWILCATTFIAGTFIAAAVAINSYEGSMMGHILDATESVIANRNVFAMQIVFSTLLTIAVVGSSISRSSNRSVLLAVSAVICVVFTLLVILSESRSALICLEICVPLAIFGNLSRARIITSAAFVAMSVLVMAGLSISGHDPVVIQRFTDDTVSTAGGRVDIVVKSTDLLQSSHTLLAGAGTAGVHKKLGSLSEHGKIHPNDGIVRESSHNMFLEWFLSYGILGAPGGIWLLGTLVLNSYRRDKTESATWRKAIMLFVLLAGLVSPFYIAMNACGVLALVLTMSAHSDLPAFQKLPPHKAASGE